jgi:regulator of sigma E protease
MITILAIVFVLMVLIMFHEMGHFLAAKSAGIRVERFYIGFNLFGLGIKKKIGETEFGLGLFPIGGYVKVAGMVDESMDTEISGAPWEFQSKNPLQKIWFASGGVVANLILAVLIFFTLTLVNGVLESDPAPVVGSLTEGYPATEAGLLPGDQILAVNGQSIATWEDLTSMIHSRPEEEVEVTWNHEGATVTRVILTRATEALVDDEIKTVGMIGIGPKVTQRAAGFGEAVAKGFALTGRWLGLTYKSLVMIITGEAGLKDIGGPIFIAQLAGESAQSGFSSVLGLLAIISINLAFINFLPIPALDGGHAVIILAEAIMRRPFSMKARIAIQQIGVVFLFALIGVILYNDIARLFQ